uniref:ribonuclease H n=1 Tax=Sphaeramia orbicularis TaxID=375764 RepID=A0A672YNH1_9TELE
MGAKSGPPKGPIMDPAKTEAAWAVVEAQRRRLHETEGNLAALSQAVQHFSVQQQGDHEEMSTQIQQLNQTLLTVLTHLEPGNAVSIQPARSVPVTSTMPPPAEPAASVPPRSSPQLATPDKFFGHSGDRRTFIFQCNLHFKLFPMVYVSEYSKLAFIISHLTGRAAEWATSEWDRGSASCQSTEAFFAALRRVFDHVAPSREAVRKLENLRQGDLSVGEYSILFRSAADNTGWNDAALRDAFRRGLLGVIKDQLAPLEEPPDLDTLIALATRLDIRNRERDQERRYEDSGRSFQSAFQHPSSSVQRLYVSSAPSAGVEEPMQLGRTHISPAERQRRRQEGRCFYCGLPGHLRSTCRVGKSRSLPEHLTLTNMHPLPSTPRRTLTPVTFFVDNHRVELGAFVDSGADENLIDEALVKRLGLKMCKLPSMVTAQAITGAELFQVTHRTEPLQMNIEDHCELVDFQVVKSLAHPIVLGFPWLKRHLPSINWVTGRIEAWGKDCKVNCVISRHNVATASISKPPITTQNQGKPEVSDLSNIPSHYHHLREVFSKSRASSLPPHRDYDCPIDLLPGAPIPKGRMYSLSQTETKAMEEYIEQSLKSGIIRPSSSPAGAGVFFVAKKDGSLRPCIDYSPLNDITVKNRHPLPLMASAFDQNAYHLVRIREGDEWKTGFNTPSGHFEYLVMPFGLANAPAVFQGMVNDVQARWSLFFNRFNFTLSYRPGSKNGKPDALSRLHEPVPRAKDPEPILPPSHVVGAVSWPIE